MLNKNTLTNSNLSKSDKHFLLTLDSFADKLGRCYPSQKTIAEYMSVSVRWVKKLLAHCLELGLVKVKRRWRKSNVYTLLCRVPLPTSSMGNCTSRENRPHIKNNVNENALSHCSKQKPPGNDLIREIESLVGSSKDRACWSRVTQACSSDTIHRAISGLRIAMNEISLRRPGAYLVSILKAEHGPGLFGGSTHQHSCVAVSPTITPVEPLKPLSESQWRDNMAGLKQVLAKLRC